MTRALYRVLLRLHPAPFRERFAAEMLWIYDADPKPFLLVDALVSVLRQHAKAQPAPQPALAAFGLLDPGPGVTPRRLAEAAAAATLVLAGVFLLLGHPPRTIGLAVCQPGTPQPTTRPLVAPSRIQPLSVAIHSQPRNGYVQTGPEQVDNGVAGALRVVRASNPHPTPFCTPNQTN